MLELWEMQCTLLLPLLQGPLWPWVIAPDKFLSMSQIELNYVFKTIFDIKTAYLR